MRQAYYILDPETDTKQEGDECWSEQTSEWVTASINTPIHTTVIYRRPIPDAPTPDDGWIPWGGGGCPVDPCTLVQWRLNQGIESNPDGAPASGRRWEHIRDGLDIIAYRIVKAPEPQWLPLTCDDVPPGSYLRPKADYMGWIVISEIDAAGVHLHGGRTLTYPELLERKWEILRPGEDWQPCKKLAK